jgi:hypothetical protein
MTSLNKHVKCSNCSFEANLSVNSDMDLKELSFAGKCPKCSATIQINFSIVESKSEPKTSLSQSTNYTQSNLTSPTDSIFSSTPSSSDSSVEEIFEQSGPSDTLKDLLDES